MLMMCSWMFIWLYCSTKLHLHFCQKKPFSVWQFLLLITLKEGCSQLGSGVCRMFYSCISVVFWPCSDLFGTNHCFPLPFRGLRPHMHCIDGSNPYCPFRCILKCPLFVFLPLVLLTSRVISPPQRKQVIGHFFIRFLQCLQCWLTPCLFFPHVSVSQSLNSFLSFQHSE